MESELTVIEFVILNLFQYLFAYNIIPRSQYLSGRGDKKCDYFDF
jgi:hypothetical protein